MKCPCCKGHLEGRDGPFCECCPCHPELCAGGPHPRFEGAYPTITESELKILMRQEELAMSSAPTTIEYQRFPCG